MLGHGARLDPEFGDAFQPFLQGRLQLDPREVRSDAAVRADAEGRMQDRLALEIDFVGVIDRERIARRARIGEHDEIAFLHLRSRHLYVASAGATQRHDRRKKACEFLDRILDIFGLLDQQPAVVGVGGEMVNGRRHDKGRRRDTAKGEIDEDRHLVLPRRRCAILIGDARQDRIDEITTRWLSLSPFQMRVEIFEHPREMSAALFRRAERPFLDAFDQHGEIVDRQAQDILEEGPSRQERTEFGDEFAMPLVDEAIDERVHVVADRLFVVRGGFRA